QGNVTINGGTATASFNTSSLAVGSHLVTASYSGDGSFLASTGTLTQTVAKVSASTLVVSSLNPSALGQAVTFTATVTGAGSPTGVVIFSDGAASIGQGTPATRGVANAAAFSSSG